MSWKLQNRNVLIKMRICEIIIRFLRVFFPKEHVHPDTQRNTRLTPLTPHPSGWTEAKRAARRWGNPETNEEIMGLASKENPSRRLRRRIRTFLFRLDTGTVFHRASAQPAYRLRNFFRLFMNGILPCNDKITAWRQIILFRI